MCRFTVFLKSFSQTKSKNTGIWDTRTCNNRHVSRDLQKSQIYRTFFWYKTRCLRGAFIFLVEKWIDKVINISRRSDRMIIITVRYRFKVLFWKSSQYICNSVVYKIVKMIIFMIVLTVLLTICGKENCSHSWRFQWTCCRCARLWGPQLTPLTP